MKEITLCKRGCCPVLIFNADGSVTLKEEENEIRMSKEVVEKMIEVLNME